MNFRSFFPYKGLLKLFGRGKAPEVARAGRPLKLEPDPLVSATHRWYQKYMELGGDRATLYRDFDAMDEDDIISSALDLYAEDATQTDGTTGKAVWIESSNSEIAELGNRLLETMEMEDRVFALARGLAKYGDHFVAVQTGLRGGQPVKVVGLDDCRPHSLVREEDGFGRLKGFAVVSDLSAFSTAAEEELSMPWDYVHFRIRGRAGDDGSSKYGTALIRAARRVFRHLSLMEQAMVIYRMRRSPDRLKWRIDVGDAPPEEANEIVAWFRDSLRKKMLIDPETGEIRSEVDPMSIDEDIFLPVSEGSGTSVDVLTGSQQVGHVLDIEYMRKRLFSCLRIPPDYMGFADASGTLTGRSPLSDQDVQFARQEKRLQRGVMVGIVFLVKIEMALRGIDPDREENAFRTRMSPVSFLEELQRAEVAKVRASIVSTLIPLGNQLGADKKIWQQYVMRVSGLPEEPLRSSKEVRPPEDLAQLTEEQLQELRRVAGKRLEGSVTYLRDLLLNGVHSDRYPLRFAAFPPGAPATMTERTADWKKVEDGKGKLNESGSDEV